MMTLNMGIMENAGGIDTFTGIYPRTRGGISPCVSILYAIVAARLGGPWVDVPCPRTHAHTDPIHQMRVMLKHVGVGLSSTSRLRLLRLFP